MINYDVEKIDVQKKENMVGKRRMELFDKSNLYGEDSFSCVKYRADKSYVCMIGACYKLLKESCKNFIMYIR